MQQTSIATTFGTHFELTLATTQALLEQVYQVRYRVYCEEFHYENEARFPDHMERDDYDACSQHCLMIHRATGRPVGCIRLINRRQGCQDRTLPFEAFCPPSPEFLINPSALPRTCFGELSRLAVVEEFRRRQRDEKKPISVPEEDENDTSERRSRFPFIPVGLFMAGIAMFLRSSTEFSFAMMEPRLVRLLQRFGILFTQAGEVVDYHGPRAPFVLPRDTALDALLPEVSELLAFVDQQLFGPPSGQAAPVSSV